MTLKFILKTVLAVLRVLRLFNTLGRIKQTKSLFLHRLFYVQYFNIYVWHYLPYTKIQALCLSFIQHFRIANTHGYITPTGLFL